jgi:peptide/nickel transport system permease protein
MNGLTPFLRRMRRNRLAMIGLAILALLLAVALVAPLLPFGDPFAIRPVLRNRPISWDHPFGTDVLGRDLFLRFAYGARLSLGICAQVALACLVIGTGLGLVAGYFGGWVDSVISRMTDTLMAFPSILLALGIVATLGPSMQNVVLTLAIVYVPRVIRVARAPAMTESRRDYVEAARSCGVSQFRILYRYVLPNIMAPVVVQVTVVFAYAMVAEAALGFLGMGVPPPAPSWGNLLAESRKNIMTLPTQTLFPALGLAMAVLGINLFGDGLRDLLDPRMRGAGEGGA